MRTPIIPAFAGSVILASSVALLMPAAAQAAVACDQASLVTAINLANSSGGGTIPLTPGCTYTLTSSNGTGMNGPDGLPIITTAISLTGNADVITRSSLSYRRGKCRRQPHPHLGHPHPWQHPDRRRGRHPQLRQCDR